ncbi:Fatty acyl-CoA reductase [Piscirickettsia salmonis]|uniref:Fatty acyl-CoA reductase n=1 Tax=Piscirickettsia salmonis TaxID=1238 RepID=A0A9Q6LPC5_PISSA|nr:SDR family NAD(P)-dependent oxidoreductase [Piscirickettsia salmonis]QGN96577.1 Fatty acyl-CoA reductase [Piscirickettsia salmonis]QGO07519.1 Fatty acyl-CoA reductase [Piscirickettsia salmonis]QGO35847.1 Fatty acyl-CoA reductase [Piscirickettsia salmonis]QGO39465.1 Fatty acyl-CoA reductase [Piscirickettsia salmonis]QGO43079.1 Fatty acyl-CoA reductase [Piscirickettsia salmonis]
MSTICITGASNGIGEALAYSYARPDNHLILIARNAERLEQVKAQCEKYGPKTTIAIINVCNHQALHDFLIDIDNQDPIHLVIANAGPSLKQLTHETTNYFSAQRLMVDTHINGTFNSIYPLIQRMQQRRSGQIAIMSSMNAKIFLPGRSIYGAVKAALLHFGLALRQQLKSDNIQVSVICPGWVKTPRTDLNQFSMPFKISAKKAALTIQKGLIQNKAIIQFPWQLSLITGIYSYLPLKIKEWVSQKLYFTNSKDND